MVLIYKTTVKLYEFTLVELKSLVENQTKASALFFYSFRLVILFSYSQLQKSIMISFFYSSSSDFIFYLMNLSTKKGRNYGASHEA
jgi:hypothetical protein